jgi:DNA-binding response OmpR family regulator
MSRILAVDDDENILTLLKTLFSSDAVSTVATLEDAKTIASQQQFDVVILDLMLPDGDGADLLKKGDLHGSIIIVLTGMDVTADNKIDLINFGVFDILDKPCNPNLLIAKVRQAITLKQTESLTDSTIITIQEAHKVFKDAAEEFKKTMRSFERRDD